MELQRLVHSLNKKRRIWLLGMVAIAGGSYGVYRLFKSPSMNRKNYKLLSFLSSIMRIAEAASVSADTVNFLSDELKNFTPSDEIPTSFKQLTKITQCSDSHQTLTGVSAAVTSGIFEGFNAGNPERHIAERAIDKLFSAAGTGFVSVLVGSCARNLILSLFENLQTLETLESNYRPSEFIDVMLSNAKYRSFIAECVEGFVGTAVAVYLDKTVDINVYDEIFSALSNPKHEGQMRTFLTGVFSGAVETFVRTSHDVLTNGSSQNRNPAEMDTLITDKEACSYISSCSIDVEQKKADNLSSGVSNTSWIDKVSYSLSIPSNRKLLVEASGRMTFEAVRSFFEFLLCKFSDFFTGTLPAAFHDALNRILQTLRYAGSKSMVAATVCLAMCWHAINGIRILDVV